MNTLEGDLAECGNETITISYRDKTRTIKAVINKNDIDKARLAIKF